MSLSILQYFHFVGRAAVGDFGVSFRTRRPVIEEIGSRYFNTLLLGVASILVAMLFGGITGIISAVRKYSVFDNLSLLVSLAGVSMPTFYLGLLLMLFFSVKLGWFPLAGKESWSNLVLPAITLGTPSAAVISRMVRSSLVDVLDQDYIRTARAKGLQEWVVISKHALRNAMINVVTVVGLQVGLSPGGRRRHRNGFCLARDRPAGRPVHSCKGLPCRSGVGPHPGHHLSSSSTC